MFGVAGGAFVRAGIVEQAVVAGGGFYVDGNVFVTIETEGPLLCAIECLMAIRTFSFKLSMALDDLARHNERLDLGATGDWTD